MNVKGKERFSAYLKHDNLYMIILHWLIWFTYIVCFCFNPLYVQKQNNLVHVIMMYIPSVRIGEGVMDKGSSIFVPYIAPTNRISYRIIGPGVSLFSLLLPCHVYPPPDSETKTQSPCWLLYCSRHRSSNIFI